MKEKQQDALVVFTDFIYALVFALLIEQVFSDALKYPMTADDIARVFLLLMFFHFLSWDWIIGRLLTFRNPYECYRRFFCELAIAAFAYGTANAVIHARLSGLLFLAAVFATAALWGNLSKRQCSDDATRRELELISHSHAAAALAIVSIWPWTSGNELRLTTALLTGATLWLFVFAYESCVVRVGATGLAAGPGVFGLPRSWLERSRGVVHWAREYLVPA